MFVEIVRDQTAGRLHRGVRLVKGQREDWCSQRPVLRIGFSVYDSGRAYVTIGRRHRVVMLPSSRMWPWLYRKLHQA